MANIALCSSVFTAIFVAAFLPLVMSGARWKAAQEMARTRRLAAAKMGARLLRMNL